MYCMQLLCYFCNRIALREYKEMATPGHSSSISDVAQVLSTISSAL